MNVFIFNLEYAIEIYRRIAFVRYRTDSLGVQYGNIVVFFADGNKYVVCQPLYDKIHFTICVNDYILIMKCNLYAIVNRK